VYDLLEELDIYAEEKGETVTYVTKQTTIEVPADRLQNCLV